MEIYIAICLDRHFDENVAVFILPENAIVYAKSQITDGAEIKEQPLTEEMIRNGWIYFAKYGSEGDSVRVEVGQLK